MKKVELNARKAYEAPEVQVLGIAPMQLICQSNTEDIDLGGDDIPWGVSMMDDVFEFLSF